MYFVPEGGEKKKKPAQKKTAAKKSPAAQKGAVAQKGAASPGKGPSAEGVDEWGVNRKDPTLQKLADGNLKSGEDGTCVRTTLNNMQRLGVAQPTATGNDPNNPRGAMVQMVNDYGWKSVPLSGSTQETVKSPYGTITANVTPADEYAKLASEGRIPSGALVFQTRQGWDYDGGSKGSDMGIVRDGGRETFNYKSMPPTIYKNTESVVILVPRSAMK